MLGRTGNELRVTLMTQSILKFVAFMTLLSLTACGMDTSSSIHMTDANREHIELLTSRMGEKSSLPLKQQQDSAANFVDVVEQFCSPWPSNRSSLREELESNGFSEAENDPGWFEKTISGVTYSVVLTDWFCTTYVGQRPEDTLLFDPDVLMQEVFHRLEAEVLSSEASEGIEDGVATDSMFSEFVDKNRRSFAMNYPAVNVDTWLLSLLYGVRSMVPVSPGPSSIAGHMWRCDAENRSSPVGMTISADTKGNWVRTIWDGNRGPAQVWSEWNYESKFVQEGNVVTETIYATEGKPAHKVNVFDVVVNSNVMQVQRRSDTNEDEIAWLCKDRPPIDILTSGSSYCASYNSALSARAIDLSGNSYVSLPAGCGRVSNDIQLEWLKTSGGITTFGYKGKTFYTWDTVVKK